MPKAASTRPTGSRSAPYQLRSVSSTTTSSMATALVSPVPQMGWAPMQQHSEPQWQHPHLTHYTSQPLMPDYTNSLPTPSLPVGRTQHERTSSQSAIPGSGPWTQEMDEILVENARRLKWDQIAEYFFNNQKSGNACRKRYARVQLERREPARWDPVRVQGVITAYNSDGMRERIWSTLANELGERWQDIERLCFTQGLKAMTSRNTSGHARRRSHAPSHHSYNSEYDHSGNDDSHEARDDSGLGSDLQDLNPNQIPMQQGGPVSAAPRYLERIPDYTDPGYAYAAI